MRKGAGKQKGSAFERMVCKDLSYWVSHGKKEDLFWRSSLSGGRATRGAKTGKNLSRQAGDICAVAPEGHVLTDAFYIEAKHYKDLAIGRFFLKQTGILAKFWLKTCQEAMRYKKQPMLIARQNGMPIIVITRVGILSGFICGYDTLGRVYVDQGAFRATIMLYDELLKCRFQKRD